MTFRLVFCGTFGLLGLVMLGTSSPGQVRPPAMNNPTPAPVMPRTMPSGTTTNPFMHRPPTGLAPSSKVQTTTGKSPGSFKNGTTQSTRTTNTTMKSTTGTKSSGTSTSSSGTGTTGRPTPSGSTGPGIVSRPTDPKGKDLKKAVDPKLVHLPHGRPTISPRVANPSVTLPSVPPSNPTTPGTPSTSTPPTSPTTPTPGPTDSPGMPGSSTRVVVKNTTINNISIVNNINNRTTIINAINPLVFPCGCIRHGVVHSHRVIFPPIIRCWSPIVVIRPGGFIINQFLVPVPVPVPVPVGPLVATAPVPQPAPELDDPLARLLPAVAGADAPALPAGPMPPAVPQPPAPAEQEFSCRYVRVANNTGENLKVFIRYRTRTDKGEWGWFPTPPDEEAEEVLSYDFKPGATADLTDADWRINASQIRIWAVSETGKKWLDFQDADLVVVPEKNPAGEPSYRAPEMQTYLFTFAG